MAAASTHHCRAHDLSKSSRKQAHRAPAAFSNALVESEDPVVASSHHSTRRGSTSTRASSSETKVSSPLLSPPVFAQKGVNTHCTTRDYGSNDDGIRNDGVQGAASSSFQQRALQAGETYSHHLGGRNPHRGQTTNAANETRPSSVRVLPSPTPSNLPVDALTPSRYRAAGGDRGVDQLIPPAAAESNLGVPSVQHNQAPGRSQAEHSGSCDHGTATWVSPGQHTPEVEAKPLQHYHHPHHATAQTNNDRWMEVSPLSSITPAAGKQTSPQQAMRRHQRLEHAAEEQFRRAELAHRLGGEEDPIASAASTPVATDPGGGEGRGRGRGDTAFATAADVAAAAEAVAMSFARRSLGSPNSLEQREPDRRQHRGYPHHHQDQRLSPLSGLSSTTEVRTLPPRSESRFPPAQPADPNSPVPAGVGAADGAASEYTSGYACGSSDSSSRTSRSECSRPYTTGSSHFSGSSPFAPAASGQRPQGPLNHDERGGSGCFEPVRSTGSDPTPRREPCWTSRPGAGSRSTPRSCAFSHTSGYSSRSRQGSGFCASTSSMYVSSISGSVSRAGSSARSGRRSKAGGGGEGSRSGIGYPLEGQERSDAGHSEMAAWSPPPVQGSRDDGPATSGSGFAYPVFAVDSRVSSSSSLHGEKVDYLSACPPRENPTTGNRNRDGGHRQTQDQQGQQEMSSLASFSPLSSPPDSPPQTAVRPPPGLCQHGPSSSQRDRRCQDDQQDQRLKR